MSVDNVDKGRLETCAANQESVNVLGLCQLLAVLLAHTATVDDSGLLCNAGRDFLAQEISDRGMNFLCLLGGRDLSGTNGPNWLVCNDNLAPVRDLLCNSTNLACNHIDGLVGLSLLEALTTAEDNTDTAVEGGLGLGCDESVGFLEDYTTLRVTEKSPCDV